MIELTGNVTHLKSSLTFLCYPQNLWMSQTAGKGSLQNNFHFLSTSGRFNTGGTSGRVKVDSGEWTELRAHDEPGSCSYTSNHCSGRHGWYLALCGRLGPFYHLIQMTPK